MSVKILAVGDVCGEPGLEFLKNRLKEYKKEKGVDFCVVNGENANVVGITPKQADAIFQAAATAAAKPRLPLAKLAAAETGMGVLEDKVIKNHFAAE